MGAISRRLAWASSGAALAMVLSSCGSGAAEEEAEAEDIAPELQELVDAAQEEGSFTLYGSLDESVLQGIGEEFTALYDVEVEPVRLVTADLTQRFLSEAESDAPASDAVLVTYSPFFADALEDGSLEPVTEADIPGYPEDFPEEYLEEDDEVPLVSMVPTSMVYNSDDFPAGPSSWEEYAEPEYDGELAIAEASSSPANLSFWQLMREEYGDDFLEAVGDNNPTWHNSAVPGTQAVAAGEDKLGHPGVQAIVDNLMETGAPIETIIPGPTTGPETAYGLTAQSQSPNAARLFGHYLFSEAGSAELAELSGAGSQFGEGLPDEYIRPEPVSDEDEAIIEDLLGSP